MTDRTRTRRETGDAADHGSSTATPGRRTLVEQRYASVQRKPSNVGVGTGSRDDGGERLPFLDVQAGADGPGAVQMQPVAGAPKAKTPKGTTPLVVHVYHRGGKVTTWRGVTDIGDLAGSAYYGGKGDDGSWSWNSELGEMVDLYKDENDRSPTPVSALMGRGSVEFVSIHIGAKDFPIPDGKQVAELSGVKRPPKKRPTGPIDPDRALFGDSDDRAEGDRRDAEQRRPGRELGSAEGVADATGTRRRDGGGDVLVGDDDEQASDGTDAAAVLAGDSQGTRSDLAPDTSGADIGRKRGPVGGATGNTNDTGRKGGRRDGVAGDRASITHNPNAEMAPGAGGNIPEDGGSRHGMAGGEEGGKKGGLPGSIGLWELISLSATTAATIHIGQVLTDADLAGAADNLISKAGKIIGARFGKRAAKRQLKQLAKAEVDALVDKALAEIEQWAAELPEWSQLDEVAKNHLRARWRYEFSQQAPKALKHELKERIAQLDEIVGDGEYMAKELGRGDDYLDDLVAGYRRERDALEEVDGAVDVPKLKQGDGEFRELPDEYMNDVKVAKEWGTVSAYWTDTTTHQGMKVYRRSDLFDPHFVRDGETNLRRMQAGRAPWGTDGKRVEIHHLNQSDEGPVVEILSSLHNAHSKTIHINNSTIPSGIERSGFDAWRRSYWMQRAKELAP